VLLGNDVFEMEWLEQRRGIRQVTLLTARVSRCRTSRRSASLTVPWLTRSAFRLSGAASR
jgi:hypothetical protein